MNITDELQIIRKSTKIATLNPVCEVKRYCIRPTKQENVPKHLRNFYERICCNDKRTERRDGKAAEEILK